jgi:cytochrome oxidase Cu insertion factor (SCO1/SenC/PrrC family)
VVIIILLLIFCLPIIFADYFYRHREFSGSVNYGKLLTPPLSLGTLVSEKMTEYQGRWVLLYAAPVCDTLCAQNLYKMRQVRLAAGKDQDRVERLLVTQTAFTMPDAYQGTYQEETAQKIQPGLYIADPHGNIILYYQDRADPEKILKDLTRLLRTSQIG